MVLFKFELKRFFKWIFKRLLNRHPALGTSLPKRDSNPIPNELTKQTWLTNPLNLGHGFLHVHLLLPLRRRLARLRVQRLLVSTLDNKRQQVRSMAPIAATRNQTNIDVGELFVWNAYFLEINLNFLSFHLQSCTKGLTPERERFCLA